VRRTYGVDGEDPDLYPRMIDFTAIDMDTSVDPIVTAGHARVPASATGPGRSAHTGLCRCARAHRRSPAVCTPTYGS
jgi:hypothetical protein